MQNPFIFGKVVTGEGFVDREKEKQRLADNITSHINTTLISPRRWGKSSLVTSTGNFLSKKGKNIRFCFIDLFNIRTEEEFYAALAKEVIRASSDKLEIWLDDAKHFIQKLTPRFNVGIDPVNDFTISMDWDEVKKNPDEILDLPERLSEHKKIQIIVCLDEFQNISFFSDPLQFQKKLRARWQYHQHSTYLIYGSKRHMMLELFNSPSMPFYKFGDLMLLEKIPENYWVDFICREFEKSGKGISMKLASRIPVLMENHPYFVQQYAHEAWTLTKRQCSDAILEDALTGLLEKNAILFLRELDSLTNMQVNFLKAVVSNIKQFSSFHVLKEYRLGTSGNVNRIKSALESKEIIDILPDNINFLDPLFKIWFKKIFMNIKQ